MPDPALAWLLDKAVIRRAVEGISASLVATPLSTEQSLTLRLSGAACRPLFSCSSHLKRLTSSFIAIICLRAPAIKRIDADPSRTLFCTVGSPIAGIRVHPRGCARVELRDLWTSTRRPDLGCLGCCNF